MLYVPYVICRNTFFLVEHRLLLYCTLTVIVQVLLHIVFVIQKRECYFVVF